MDMLLEQRQRHMPNCVPKAISAALRRSLWVRYGWLLAVNLLETLLERVSKDVTDNWNVDGMSVSELIEGWHNQPDKVRRVDVLAESESCTYSFLFDIGVKEIKDDFDMVRKLVENERFGFAVVVITKQCFENGRPHAVVAKCLGHDGGTLHCADAQGKKIYDVSFSGCTFFAIWADLPKADKFVNGEKTQEIEKVDFQNTFRNDVKAYLGQAYFEKAADTEGEVWLRNELAKCDPTSPYTYLPEHEGEQFYYPPRRAGDLTRAPVHRDCLKQLFLEFLRKWADIDFVEHKLHASYEHLIHQKREWISLPEFVECCREHGLNIDCQRIVKAHHRVEAVDMDGAMRAAEFQEEHDVVTIVSAPRGHNVPFLGNKLLAPVNSWAGTAIFPEDIDLPPRIEAKHVVAAYKLALRTGVYASEPGSPVRSSVLRTYTCDLCELSIHGSHFRNAWYSRYDLCEACRSKSTMSELIYLRMTEIVLTQDE